MFGEVCHESVKCRGLFFIVLHIYLAVKCHSPEGNPRHDILLQVLVHDILLQVFVIKVTREGGKTGRKDNYQGEDFL